MSLSLHSSMDALTSSKRGLEKDRLIEPEKSSIGESSERISSRPEVAVGAAVAPPSTRARHAALPTSQSKDSVCSARRFGTSSGSRILAKVVRGGDPGIPNDVPLMEVELPELETAKMRPSKDCDPSVFTCTTSSPLLAQCVGCSVRACPVRACPVRACLLWMPIVFVLLCPCPTSPTAHHKQTLDGPGVGGGQRKAAL